MRQLGRAGATKRRDTTRTPRATGTSMYALLLPAAGAAGAAVWSGAPGARATAAEAEGEERGEERDEGGKADAAEENGEVEVVEVVEDEEEEDAEAESARGGSGPPSRKLASATQSSRKLQSRGTNERQRSQSWRNPASVATSSVPVHSVHAGTRTATPASRHTRRAARNL